MYLVPGFLFRKWLKGKSVRFRFAFCQLVMINLVNLAVLGLGLLHILNVWVARILFYGAILIVALRRYPPPEEEIDSFFRLLGEPKGMRVFLLKQWRDFQKRSRNQLAANRRCMKGRWGEFILLGALLLFGFLYFGWSGFYKFSFGSGELYVHHSWVYGLLEGEIFPEGVCPEGMHCFIYAMHALFGVSTYSCMLYVQKIHVLALILAVYCLARTFLRSRYSPFLVLALFLFLEQGSSGYDRLGLTLPMEFGLPASFLCAVFLWRYLDCLPDRKTLLKQDKRKRIQCRAGTDRDERTVLRFRNCAFRRPWWLVWNADLFLFALSLSATLAVHVFDAILALFLCLGVVLCCIPRIFARSSFFSLVVAVAFGFITAAFPAIAAILSGFPLHTALSGAMSVAGVSSERSGAAVENGFWNTIYNAYRTLFGSARGACFAVAALLVLFACLLNRVLIHIPKGDARLKLWQGHMWRPRADFGRTYLPAALSSVILGVSCAAPLPGHPAMVDDGRLLSAFQMVNLIVAVAPADALISQMERSFSRKFLLSATAVCAAAIYIAARMTGTFHSYMGELGMVSNTEVNVANSICEEFEKNRFTIVSNADELYQINPFGRHEESAGFLRNIQEARYIIPTEEVFLFVEKHPVLYAQMCFADGPSWLAKPFSGSNYAYPASTIPNMMKADIFENIGENLQKLREAYPNWNYYEDNAGRIWRHRAMYNWCQSFQRRYPNEMTVYYEDEDFVCYHFSQDMMDPYNLAFD